ncbi:M28 family peptidase [Leptobacterium flavescens]|uniref:M28 family peptidase n=1 Tax=Leptobacterium flavescens TaxID=472055 RepID=A0A6P0UNI8_9FLAO|nr:M28 family metallopeptidase [Leptobacterium flavescens]NER14020.1 M28 family peptidase [Leptobacterium flavescens]
MKKVFLVLLGLTVACNSAQQTTTEKKEEKKGANYDPTPYAQTITQEDLTKHLYTYASDEFQGRETGQPGQKKAVNYLKDHYVKMGIPAAKSDGDYFQNVPLEISSVPGVQFSVNGKDFTLGKDFATFGGPGNISTGAANVVYAGYGIEDEKYSDYANLDVKGKVVLIKAGEPKNDDGTYKISGSSEASKWSNLRQAFNEKIGLAREKGAKGLLFFDEANFGVIQQQFNFLKNQQNGRISLKSQEKNPFFYLFVNKDVATAVYPGIESTYSSSTQTADLKVAFESKSKEISSENVVAYIKGSEKPNEFLVISAHLDHEGVKNGEVYNGADDDGSGTVAVLEIAEAFKKAADDGNGPKRSVVFLHVTGEEKGLLGSRYYTDNPIFPLESTVADLNIDMIGRTDPKREGDRNYVYLIGSDKLSTELHNLSEEVNKKYTNITLDYTYNDENDPNRFYYRSDHYNFAKNNVPIIFYFNGTHDDYHRPSDTPDKIQYDLLTNRTKLVFYTAWEVANRDKRIIADKAVEAK